MLDLFFIVSGYWCVHVWLHSVCVPLFDGVCSSHYCEGWYSIHWKQENGRSHKPPAGSKGSLGLPCGLKQDILQEFNENKEQEVGSLKSWRNFKETASTLLLRSSWFIQNNDLIYFIQICVLLYNLNCRKLDSWHFFFDYPFNQTYQGSNI